MGSAFAYRWYLAFGGLLLVAALAAPPLVKRVLIMVLAVSVVVVVIVGVRRYRPVWSRPWWLVVATVIGSLGANLGWVFTMTATGELLFPSVGDLFYTLSMVLLTAAVYWWIRPGRYRGGLIDAAIALTGGGAVVWVFVLTPLLFDDRAGGLRLGSYLLYIGLDLLILACTVRVAVISRVRTVAYRLMVGASTLWVVTDTVHYAALFGGVSRPNNWAMVGWLSAFVMVGAAALHPSMARSTGSMPRNAAPMSRFRLGAYVALTTLIAGLSVYGFENARPAHQTVQLTVMIGIGCATSVLLIVRLAHLGAALNRRAYVDPLTGLGNRAALQNYLHRRAAHERVLLVMDLDDFREINAAFGHQVGDAVLVETGHRLRAAAPSDAVVVRLDADAFAVLTRGGEAVFRTVAEQLLQAIADPYPAAGLTSRRVQAVIGGVALPAGADDGATALRDADLALDDARSEGNRMAIFHARAYAQWKANRDMVADLRHAATAGEFSMHYQPIVDLDSGTVVAAEALLRWTRGDGTSVSPGQFIPLAEQSGEITVIGEWVIEQVCSDLDELWRVYQLPVTVNVSAHQLRDPLFAGRLISRLERTGLPGAALIVEITETVLMTSVADAAGTILQLQELRTHGVRIAVDDFGTGYSSLAYLRELPVDILKMDGSFTSQQIENGGPQELAFVRTIVDLGHSLNLLTLAEAVETPAQAERLRQLGCHLAQGYHFARPAPITALHDLLAGERVRAAA